MPNDITVKVHPLTVKVGVLYINGGGTRGIVLLMLMKIIQNRINVPIPLLRFIKVVFKVSIGKFPNRILRNGINAYNLRIGDCYRAFY